MAIGFEHPKATVHIGDGLEFLRGKVNMYDVIITDSSDPDGKVHRCVIIIMDGSSDFVCIVVMIM